MSLFEPTKVILLRTSFSLPAILRILKVGNLAEFLLDTVTDLAACLMVCHVQQSHATLLLVARLLAVLTDPIRVASLARVVIVGLAFLLLKV